ncbi:N-acetylmuramic acid 6-phosphate etherase [Hyphococcus sp. DH-69]|uniref:N-acetylmuramic acid 6-phosphate etherase n=1 Tax=Hyphococcus formosus TaxID=3143534 RepID=UPI00398B6760
MSTEDVSQRFVNIDSWPAKDAVDAMIDGQLAAVASIQPLSSKLADAATAAAARLADRGRLIYVGAGTSGRVAAQDGVELFPTYGWPNERLVYVVAGGPTALVESAEGAEDDVDEGAGEIEKLNVGENDVVIGVAASGRTPFTIAALEVARQKGALTIGIVNNPGAPLLETADFGLVAETGSEVVAGSTRMKAGTAQKAILNILSTTIMLQLGKVYKGLMVNMVISNKKLRHRGAEIVHKLSGVSMDKADAALTEANNDIPTAVLIGFGLEKNDAAALLARHKGHLGASIEALKG